jgi:transposase
VPQLTYREAAKRVHRSRRTIRHWRTSGMPMGWETRNGQRVRVVDEHTLLSWWRQRMQNDPIRQQRIRARKAAETAAQTQTRRVENQS